MATLFGQEIQLESRSMHVAPGGSVIYAVSGACRELAKYLEALREEVAYGMCSIQDLGDGRACASIYFGAADEDIASDFVKQAADLSVERSAVAEGEKRDGLSIGARNQVIDILRRS